MQLVVLTAGSPTHEDTLAAAAQAVVLLLSEVDSDPDHPAAAHLARWRSGRIRKVVRRAKAGAEWDRAVGCGSPAVHVARVGTATVAAFSPTAVDGVPAGVRRLQVSGLDLPRSGSRDAGARAAHLAVSPYLGMSTGKAAAQVAHAAQILYQQLDEQARSTWVQGGAPVSIELPDRDRWLRVASDAPVTVRDAGFTEVPPGSRTVVAYAPVPRIAVTPPGRNSGPGAPSRP
jgi:peptidyl-tRNA hydrolase